jgi:hypothetical protein
MLRELAPLAELKGDHDAVDRVRTLLELRTKDSP